MNIEACGDGEVAIEEEQCQMTVSLSDSTAGQACMGIPVPTPLTLQSYAICRLIRVR